MLSRCGVDDMHKQIYHFKQMVSTNRTNDRFDEKNVATHSKICFTSHISHLTPPTCVYVFVWSLF